MERIEEKRKLRSVKCEIFGHKWRPVIIRKANDYRFMAVYCKRWKCYLGYDDLIDFVRKNKPIINSYLWRNDMKYWKWNTPRGNNK